MNPRYWLLLEKSDATRISKGIDGYRDVTGEVYHYDSLVPNHRQLPRFPWPDAKVSPGRGGVVLSTESTNHLIFLQNEKYKPRPLNVN